MKKLFDIVPPNFFGVLSSSNREIYFDALIILYSFFKDELNIRVDDYISNLSFYLEDKAFEIESDEEQSENSLTASGKARFIMNRLERAGWIDKEHLDGSFVEILTPRSYAIPILKLLYEIGDDTVDEYGSLVFSTYSGLRQALSEDRTKTYDALLSAKLNTEKLQVSLRALYHAIRNHIRLIIEQNDINFIIEDHFSEYKKMVDRLYHPIKTLDSVFRYMDPIQGLLTDILADDVLLKEMRERAISVRKYEDIEQAEKEIETAIDYILDAYQKFGVIISEIDRKHSAYTKNSIEKIQYLMSADQTIKGKLAALLRAYSKADQNDKAAISYMLEDNIELGRQEYLDEKSLYHKNIRSRRINKDPLPISELDGLEINAEDFLLEQFKNGYPAHRVREYVNSLFIDGKKQISSYELELSGNENFILLMMAVVRQKEHGMNYRVEFSGGKVNRNGYIIPDMIIKLRGADTNVE